MDKIKLEKEIINERGRLSSDRMDISFGELINLYKNDELIIRPEYQRLYRWTAKQKTALIESILLAIPIPPIFVAEDEDGIWELVDGLQRVATFISFFGDLKSNITELTYKNEDNDEFNEDGDINTLNKWELQTGGLIKSLQGFTIDTLPTKYKINLKRAVCRIEILRGESNTSMKYELFKRLNSGGSKLTPQEIRNAIYRGINPKLNELIIELSQNHVFQKLTNLTKIKKQQLYDNELILRFIAFYDNLENVNESMENYLNNFMEEKVTESTFQTERYRKIFGKVMNLIDKLNEDKIFRNPNNLFVPAVFDGITIGVAQNIELYKNDTELLRERIVLLKKDDKFKATWLSNSKNRIKNRLKRANEIFNQNKK